LSIDTEEEGRGVGRGGELKKQSKKNLKQPTKKGTGKEHVGPYSL
jgi:hypothetical protein